MDRDEEIALRLECVELAIEVRKTGLSYPVLTAAQEIYDFVTKTNAPETETEAAEPARPTWHRLWRQSSPHGIDFDLGWTD